MLGADWRPTSFSADWELLTKPTHNAAVKQMRFKKLICPFMTKPPFSLRLRASYYRLTPFSLLVQLLDEARSFHFLNKTLIDEDLRIRRAGFGIFRSHVVEQRLYACGVGIRHIQKY
jgi:hypothetical protein